MEEGGTAGAAAASAGPKEESTGPSPPAAPFRRAREWGWAFALVGVLAIIAGGILIETCSSITLSPGCTQESAGSCVESGACPALSGLGVVLLSVSVLVLGFGVYLIIGRQPEGAEPHPEPPSKKGRKETVKMRMDREREEARREREEAE